MKSDVSRRVPVAPGDLVKPGTSIRVVIAIAESRAAADVALAAEGRGSRVSYISYSPRDVIARPRASRSES